MKTRITDYIITIKVTEKTLSCIVTDLNGAKIPEIIYSEIIGTLEIVKANIIHDNNNL